MIPPTAEAVVIGGGVVGLSVAYNLAQHGCPDVLVLERARLGGGSTSKASGAIRQQFDNETEVVMAARSVRSWVTFEEVTGANLNFRQVGYLYLLSSADELRRHTLNVSMQRRLGVPSELLAVEDAQALVPGLSSADLVGATFCPTDGRAIPAGAVEGFARQARALGVRIVESAEVTGLRIEKQRVVGVETREGVTHTRYVVNAAGPQARGIASMAGFELPLRVQRVHQVVTDPVEFPESFPCVLEIKTSLFLAKEGAGLLLGLGGKEPPSTETSVEWSFLPQIVEAAIHRLPSLSKRSVRAAWTGLSEYSPDRIPIVGSVPGLNGFYCANGMSGHGFMLAPAVGEALADLIVSGSCPWLDLARLSIERFSAAPAA